MQATAVVLQAPRELGLQNVSLKPVGPQDLLVEIRYSGISTGTEKLLWSGEMPPFPGMGYPLVPGYESVGQVVEAGAQAEYRPGDMVFVPGANCYEDVRGLFGGAAARLVVPSARVSPVDGGLGRDAVLLALAATARHALAGNVATPDLIVGHGVLGRLLARMSAAMGRAATVWEVDADRAAGAVGYDVIHPEEDPRRDYAAIYDASGDASLLDSLVGRLAPGGEITLAGFYPGRIDFAFAPAFMKEARLRIAAEWKPSDMVAVRRAVAEGLLSLDGLITHTAQAADATDAYQTAFSDPGCLKMILDWKGTA
ncbi:MAG: chlorophyll synthesis pathway protein BchC [Paracoccaceae bacterium]